MIEFKSDIYNQETKERFMNSIDLEKYPPRWWERVFEKSYIFEVGKQKDLYSFTTPEILEFYKFLDIGTITPLIVYNTNLVIYAQWALNENLISDGQNHFANIDNDLLGGCISTIKLRQSILSYEEFQDLIRRQIINEQDKYIFYCLWEGIKGKDYTDIIKLQLNDIDENTHKASLSSGRTVHVSQEFIDTAKLANSQNEYVGLTEKEYVISLIPSVTIYKEKSNSRGIDTGRTVYHTIVRNINTLDELADVITAKSIQDSGMIYYLNQRADELNVTVEELMYSLDTCQDILDKYNFNTHVRKRWIMQYKEFLH